VLLSRSQKENGSPAVPSRWLLRLKQLAAGIGIEAMLNGRKELLRWAVELDRGVAAKRTLRPAPAPPVAVRPHRLSVTEIEKWIRDPYAIYAKHVLKLKPLDPIDQEPGPAQRGIAIHRVMEQFLKAFPKDLPADALDELLRLGRQSFVETGAGPSVLALWMPRFERAASWFIGFESKRRNAVARSLVEVRGQWRPSSAHEFELHGRADRIDLFPNGSAAIIDYKSGRAPTERQIQHLLSPQLPLEGAMLLAGAIGEIAATSLTEFVHVRLTGGDPAGSAEIPNLDPNQLAAEARRLLQTLIERYDDESEPYRSRVAPFKMRESGDYDHLARVTEWWLAEAEP
jgi:ATP-dependent helicase/nuclease subunit B